MVDNYELVRQALVVTFLISLPIVAVSAISGTLAAAVQSVFGLPEPAAGYALRLVGVVLVGYALGSGFAEQLVELFRLALAR